MTSLFGTVKNLWCLGAMILLYGAQTARSEAPDNLADRVALELSIPVGAQSSSALTARREYAAKIDNCTLTITVKEDRDSFCRSTISVSRTAEVVSVVDLSAISRVDFLEDPRGLVSLVFLLRRGRSWAGEPVHSEYSSNCGGDVSEFAAVSRPPAIFYPKDFSKYAEQLLNEYIKAECRTIE